MKSLERVTYPLQGQEMRENALRHRKERRAAPRVKLFACPARGCAIVPRSQCHRCGVGHPRSVRRERERSPVASVQMTWKRAEKLGSAVASALRRRLQVHKSALATPAIFAIPIAVIAHHGAYHDGVLTAVRACASVAVSTARSGDSGATRASQTNRPHAIIVLRCTVTSVGLIGLWA